MSASTTVRHVTKQAAASAPRAAARSLHVAGDAPPPEAQQSFQESLAVRAEKVAAIAAKYAAVVDRESRFPAEAFAAARAERLLSAAVPRELGGDGASISDIVDVCYVLGRACASTAMIFAMHQTKVACITRHGRGSAWHQSLMRRMCSEQMLLASSTTEGDPVPETRPCCRP